MISSTIPIQSMRLNVPEAETSTEIIMGRGLLAQAPELLARYQNARFLLVSDERIAERYAGAARDALTGSGHDAPLITIQAREESKTLDTLAYLYEACQSFGVLRNDVVVAIGGGLVGDVAGMLAATYMRGLELIQVPTSLVAMVSASIGGKVGLNFKDYKNLVGAFKQPAMTIIDLETLSTLPEVEYRSGLGELVTVGALGSREIFETLESGGETDLDSLIWAALRCKKEIVEADPFDRLGIRAKLNLGHTFGHALEKLSDFSLPHGLAVAVGLHIAARLAAELGLCLQSLPDRICRTLRSLDLPVALRGYHPADMLKAMRGDKKRAGGRLRWVLPVDVGQVTLFGEENMPPELLTETLRALVWEGQC